ncbi:LuxR C-terminal-related transcriptional regulator [Cupriavidus oxalaticus]|uniref:LuxR C-terminal-related transcriptional regulator n=1 Tax=Cupriavidus oxalaticus TaxID=96344 RepID=UPI001F0FE34D|nr:LuxR C-terminal-related transcriptional regulator [Cupriavidus oxalaticus]
MTESIEASRLQPARMPQRMIAREALLARLLDARSQRCVVVQGPAGIGKTTALAAWRQALLSLDHDVAWLSLTAEDDEPGRFFQCLLASLAEVDPTIVREASLLMGRDSHDSAIEHWVITLVQAIAGRRRALTLMLDDAHHLKNPRALQALQWMLEYAPAQFHLAIGTRPALPLALTGIRPECAIAVVGMEDLRFSPEDSERFLRARLPTISRQEARSIHELTDGWAAGLQLLAIDLKKRHKAVSVRSHVQLRDAASFSGYFEQEVLAHLPGDDVDLLTRLSACAQYCASLAAALTGQPRGAARMTARLAGLDNRNPFISRLSEHGHETWYRLHPLMREVLLARFQAWPASEQKAAHATAWRWFEARGHTYEAVRHAIRAGEPEAAANVVEDHAMELLDRGELSQLSGLLRELPAGHVRARFKLCLAIGYTQLYSRDVAAAHESIAYMEATWGPSLDAGQRYALMLLRGALGLQQDDSDAVMRIMPQLTDVPDGADDFTMSGRSNVLSWMYLQRGEYQLARDLLEQAARRGGAPRGGLLGRSFAGAVMAMDGPISQAERIFREVLQEADRYGAAFLGIACHAAGLLADALYEANEYEAVCRLLQDRIDMLERVAPPDTVMRAMVVLADSHRLAGRRLESNDYLERLHDRAVALGLDRMLAYALDLRLRWHLEQSEVDLAQAVLLRLESAGERHADAGAGTGWETRHIARSARVALSLHWNDFEDARARLPGLIADARTVGRRRRAACLQLQLAIAEQELGHTGAARALAADALRQAHELGLVRSVLNIAPRAAACLADILREAAPDPVLAFYLQRLETATQTPQPGGEVSSMAFRAASESLNERELKVIELLAQAMPNKKIARTLGVSPDTVKWNLKNIYAKLGVSSRDEAVARMRSLAQASAPA